MRALGSLAAVVLCGCLTVPRPPEISRQTDDAHVAALALKFPKDGEGLCTIELAVPGRPAEDGETGELVWELWLEGHPFAAGVARPELKLPRGKWSTATLKLPLVFRNAGWSADPRQMRVRFAGRLVRQFGLDTPATALDEQRVVTSEGSVSFDRGGAFR